MKAVRRALLLTGLVAVALCAGGCTSMWHELQPHRLQRLNRGPGMPTGPEAYSALVTDSTVA
jgi:hypothetical protein